MSREGVDSVPFHPVATESIEVVGVGAALGLHATDAAGQRLCGPVGPGLVAKEVVGVQVEAEYAHHRLERDAFDGEALLLAIGA